MISGSQLPARRVRQVLAWLCMLGALIVAAREVHAQDARVRYAAGTYSMGTPLSTPA